MRYLLLFSCAALACAQGTDPKPKADDYEVSGRAQSIALGAEYMVHSFMGDGKTFFAPDFLVVEVALYPPQGQSVHVSSAEFTLRVDGKRKTLTAASGGMVAESLRRRNWQQQRGVEATAGIGDGEVVLGAPQQGPTYGGPTTRRTPAPPRAPEPENRSGLPPAEPVKADELVVKTALPEGIFRGPVSGYLYFAYEGKASKVKSVELIYGETSLKLK